MRTMKTIGAGRPVQSQQRLAAALRDGWAVVSLAGTWLDERLEKRKSRRLLQELTDYQLKDIGLTRADAFKEGQRRFWD